jgi:hypothetical protein
MNAKFETMQESYLSQDVITETPARYTTHKISTRNEII